MADGDEEDQASKTEDPTEKRLEEAFEKGQVVNSRELNSFFILLLATLNIVWFVPYAAKKITSSLRYLIENAAITDYVSSGMISLLLRRYASDIFLFLLPMLCVTTIVALFSSYFQHGGFVLSVKPITPSLDKLSLLKGFKRIASVKSLLEFFKGIFKITLVGAFVYMVIMNDIKELSQYQELSISGILAQLAMIIRDIFILVTIVMAAIATVDFAYQKYDHFMKLKMTKQEVKEEHKQSEGSPEIKKKIRALRQEQSKKILNVTVPESTVVITNPEHFAVALRYKEGQDPAPICVAKGVDEIAQSIKLIAGKHDIPVIENKPLARALHAEVEINEEIPTEHFEAVAKIITYVMNLEQERKRRKHNPV